MTKPIFYAKKHLKFMKHIYNTHIFMYTHIFFRYEKHFNIKWIFSFLFILAPNKTSYLFYYGKQEFSIKCNSNCCLTSLNFRFSYNPYSIIHIQFGMNFFTKLRIYTEHINHKLTFKTTFDTEEKQIIKYKSFTIN